MKAIFVLIGLVFVSATAQAEAIGPLTVRGTIKSVSARLVELQTDGETLLVPREFVSKEKLQSKSQIVIPLTDEQILEVQVK